MLTTVAAVILITMLLLAAALLTLEQTLHSLRAIRVADDDMDVPAAARPLLRSAKAQLRERATSLLRGQPGDANVAAAHLRAAMRLPKDDNLPYGTVTQPDITVHGDIIAVEVTFGVPCGGDAVLFLFRYNDGWRCVLDRERNDYAVVTGSAGWFAFDVSPPDARGNVLVISSDISTSCNSNFQLLRWRVDRIGRRSSHLVMRQRDGIYIGDEDWNLHATANGFSIEYATYSFDPDRTPRWRLLHYEVGDNDDVKRVEPIAKTPEDAAEEWMLARGIRELAGNYAVSRHAGKIEVTFTSGGGKARRFLVAETNGTFRVIAQAARR